MNAEWTIVTGDHEIRQRHMDDYLLQTYRIADGWVYRAFMPDGTLLAWGVTGRVDADTAQRVAEEWLDVFCREHIE